MIFPLQFYQPHLQKCSPALSMSDHCHDCLHFKDMHTNQCSFFRFLFCHFFSFSDLKILFHSFNYILKAKNKANFRDTVWSFTHKRCETRENDLPKFKAIYQGHSDFSADAVSLKCSSVNSTIKLQVEYHQQTFNIAYHQPLKKYNCRLVLYFFLSPLQNYA